MILTIIDYYGKEISIEAHPLSSILQLRIDLFKRIDRIDDIGLNGIDTAFDNDKTLQEYGIDEKSNLVLLRPIQVHIPGEIFCSLSGSIFLDPVKLPCGATVERQVIERYIQSEGISPFNRKKLSFKDLQSDVQMLAEVNNYFDSEKNNPFIAAIREKKQYKIEPEVARNEEVRGAENPDEDDLLAMDLLANTERPILPPVENQEAPFNMVSDSEDDLYGTPVEPSSEENLRVIFRRLTAPSPQNAFFSQESSARLLRAAQERVASLRLQGAADEELEGPSPPRSHS